MRRRRRTRIILRITLLLIAVCALLYWRSLFPTIREVVRITVSNRGSQAINDAVAALLADDPEDSAALVLLQKDVKGNVTAVETNTARVNRLRTKVLEAVDKQIQEVSVAEIGIPLGNILMPSLFSGVGPLLPVRILSVSSSDAEFVSGFAAAGINQTVHRITLNVRLTMTVLSPAGTEEISSDAQIIAAETVIVGVVPETYWKVQK